MAAAVLAAMAVFPARGVAADAASIPLGWQLSPAGVQVEVGALPLAVARTPDGKRLLVLNAGGTPSLALLDAASGRQIGSAAIPNAWLGLALSPAGDRAYVGGGSHGRIYEFQVSSGGVQLARTFAVPQAGFIGDLALAPGGRLLYALDLDRDQVVVVNPETGGVAGRYKTGRRPFRILFAPGGKQFYVTHWAEGTVGQYDTATGNQLTATRVGPHPSGMAWRTGEPTAVREGDAGWKSRLFVAAANSNGVYVLGISDGRDPRLVESIRAGFSADQPLGMTPSALALSADGTRLFAACSDANLVSVFDVSSDRSVLEGFLPTGAYPVAVDVTAGGALAVVNAAGTGNGKGSLSLIPAFTSEQLDVWTGNAPENAPYRDSQLSMASPLPKIEHAVYVLTGGEPVAGSVAAVARLDGFHVTGDSAVEAIEWATAGIASDYARLLAPLNRAGRRSIDDFFDGGAASLPPAGFIWTSAATAGITIRNFGMQAEADAVRGKQFLTALTEWEQEGAMPRLVVLRLDDGAALAPLVDALAGSRFWSSTALFAVPAAPGTSRALVVSPLARKGAFDGSLYDSASVLRTIELLLGLKPMTQFDAAARVMTPVFAPAAGAGTR
jgi:DNA-binding beta-propeller fold protein YncE